MSGGVDGLRVQRRGQKAVVMKYVLEVKSLLVVEFLGQVLLSRLKILSRLLEEKSQALKLLDKQIIKEYPTEEMSKRSKKQMIKL